MKAEAAVALPVSFKHYAPAKPLGDFVELIWYWHGYPEAYAKERLLPMPTMELIVMLGKPRTSHSGLSGPRSESLIIERGAKDEIVGVHFKPGGAFPFLGLPSGELHNGGVTLGDLWGEQRASRLLCLLNEEQSIEGRFRILESWLLWIADRPLQRHPAVSFAIGEFQENPSLSRSAEVAEKTNLSQRRFIQLFRDEVGMTPKLFCRVERFQSVIRRLRGRDQVDWIDVALECGYSDQSHFIHDFREFSGIRPTEYLDLRTDHLNHLRVRE